MCPHIVVQQPDLLDLEDADSHVVDVADIRAFKPTLPLPLANEGHRGVHWGPCEVEYARFYAQEHLNEIIRLSSSQRDTPESQGEVIPTMKGLVTVMSKCCSTLPNGHGDDDLRGYERNKQRGCKRTADSRRHHHLDPRRRKRD